MKLVAVRVRGMIGQRKQVKDTLDMLGLKKKHTCVILPENASVVGMLKKVDDYVLWGAATEETIALLEEKRGSKAIKNEFKQVYFLAPPKKGYRKGIKIPASKGGVIGKSDTVNELITRMV